MPQTSTQWAPFILEKLPEDTATGTLAGGRCDQGALGISSQMLFGSLELALSHQMGIFLLNYRRKGKIHYEQSQKLKENG